MEQDGPTLVAISVIFSQAEYRKLRALKGLTPDGTMNNVIRSKLGLQPRAQGQRKPTVQVLREGEFIETIGQYQ